VDSTTAPARETVAAASSHVIVVVFGRALAAEIVVSRATQTMNAGLNTMALHWASVHSHYGNQRECEQNRGQLPKKSIG
jgi:hypothetical protein